MAPGLSSKTRTGLGLKPVLLSPSYRLAGMRPQLISGGRPQGGALNFIHPCPQPCKAHLRQGGLLGRAVGLSLNR